MAEAEDRRIFSGKCGGAEVRADPAAAYRAFVLAASGDPDPDLAAAAKRPVEGEKEDAGDRVARLEAEGRLADATARAFALPAYDPQTGQGHTESELLDLMDQFLGWLEKNA